MNDTREAFEKYGKDIDLMLERSSIKGRSYSSDSTEEAWRAWEFLERTLATKELAETKLREALKKALRCISVDLYPQLCCEIREALSTPITTEALDSYVAERVKEARVQQKPSGYFYEWDTELGVHRAFVAGSWNSRQPDRSIEYYLAPPLPPQPTEQPK